MRRWRFGKIFKDLKVFIRYHHWDEFGRLIELSTNSMLSNECEVEFYRQQTTELAI